jgi:16S rRNA (cytidine1402-2'-O)-methyltransferase
MPFPSQKHHHRTLSDTSLPLDAPVDKDVHSENKHHLSSTDIALIDEDDIIALPHDESSLTNDPASDNMLDASVGTVLDIEPNAMPEHIPTGGILYVVSTPIGNRDDITLRAIYILKTVDLIVCEEYKMGKRLLYEHRLTKDIETLNEHNEAEQTPILLAALQSGKSIALVSDAGTPLLADPGMNIVRRAIGSGISVQAIPGASSILTALVTSGFGLHEFVFAGFLPREPKDRIAKLQEYVREQRTIVLLETPYRLLPVLEALTHVMPERSCYVGCNLTMPHETHHYGTTKQLLEKFSISPFKGEFVICLGGRNVEQGLHHSSRSHGRFERDDRGERKSYSRDDRGERKSYSRDDRGERKTFSRDDRGERKTFSRDDRGERKTFSRDDRGERKSFSRDDRGERKSYSRDDRGERKHIPASRPSGSDFSRDGSTSDGFQERKSFDAIPSRSLPKE